MLQAIATPQQQQDGCKQNFEEFVQRHQQRLYKKAYEVLQNHHDAEDAVQEALLKAYEHFLSYTEDRKEDLKCKMQAWLCTIVHTTALNMRRDKKCHDSLDATEESQHLDIRDTRFEAPEEAFEREETWQALHRLIPTLPPMDRFLVKLRYFLNYKYTSLARFLNQQGLGRAENGALRVRIHRDLAHLRNALEEAGISRRELEGWSEWSTAFDEATEIDEMLSAEECMYAHFRLSLCSPELRIAESSFEDSEDLPFFSSHRFDSKLCAVNPHLIFQSRSNMLQERMTSGREISTEFALVNVRQVFSPSSREERTQ